MYSLFILIFIFCGEGFNKLSGTSSTWPSALSAWTKRKKLTFNNASQAENLSSFPVLVSLSSSTIDYANTQAAGQDIRFVDDDGATILSHEIEAWDESATSIVWVKTPQIDGSSSTDYIWMYYGNSSANDGQSATDVWSNGYKAVWHLNGSANDSTANGFSGTVNGATVTTGKFASAYNFVAANPDNIALGAPNSIIQDQNYTSYQAWINPATIGGDQHIISFSNNAGTNERESFKIASAGGDDLAYYLHGADGDAIDIQITSLAPISAASTWYHVAATVDYITNIFPVQADAFVYSNGAKPTQAGSVDFPTANGLDNTTSARGFIGADEDGTTGPFNGIIDEVRISDVARSDDWIAAQYASQNNTMISFGGEETQ